MYELQETNTGTIKAEISKVYENRKQHKLLIPSTFDLFNALPVKERKHIDKYAFVTTYLYKAQFLGKYEKGSYVPVHKETLKKFVTARRASDVINFWINQGVIEVNNGYLAGSHSKSYRFTKKWRKVKAVETMVLDEVFERRLTTLRIRNIESVDTSQPQLAYLLRNLQDVRIDHHLAYKWLLDEVASGVDINYDKHHSKLTALINEEWFFVRDTKGRRVHNNFVNLAKPYKPYVYLQHNPEAVLVNFDVANSQPLMLAMLMLKEYGSELKSDARTFLNLCEAGTLYQHLIHLLNLHHLTKKEFKTKLFTWFYSKNCQVVNSVEWKAFSKEFPSVAEYIYNYKKDDYKALSHAMQQEESSLVIDVVVKQVAKQYPSSWCLTVHDSITTTEDMGDVVIDALLNAYMQRGIQPKINLEYLK